MSTNRKKALATVAVWVVYLALLAFGKPLFGPATESWSWTVLAVALILTLSIWVVRRRPR